MRPAEPMSPWTLRALPATTLAGDPALLDACDRLWLRAFAGEPWHARAEDLAVHREVVERQLAVPDTQALLAVDPGGRLLGAVWGWPGANSPEDELHRLVRATLGPGLVERYWRPEAVVLVELMVDPAHQGQGIGGRLLEAFVDRRRCWMLSHSRGAGLPLYLRRGWREAGRIQLHGRPTLILTRDTPHSE